MADKTTNFGLNLPLGSEIVDQEMYNENFEVLDTEVAKRITAVNGVKANENGEAIVNEIPFARQIVTDEQQQSSAEYTFRTTGGDASLSDGDATLVGIFGRSVHTGIINEVFTMTVTPAARVAQEGEEHEEPITATIDKATFLEYVMDPASITVELLYTDMWSANPSLYGITVIGTPIAGDAITVEYVRPDRGTITPSNPTKFTSTGWNLYNNSVGYARVKKYSNTYNFIVGGTYESLKFSATLDGVRQDITVSSNRFSIPSDGYVFVTGGNAITTCIYMTWSDWTSGYEGTWKAYEESVVDFSEDAETAFPYGMCQVGPITDEIDFSVKHMIRRIDRTAYSAATIETLINTGVAYEADTDYIYYVLANPIVTDFDVTNIYTANDHGEEILDGDVAPLVLTLYGENLVEKLQHDIPNQIAANSTAIAKLNSNANSTTDILATALNCTKTAMFKGAGSGYTGSVPNSAMRYGTFFVNVIASDKFVLCQSTAGVHINSYSGNSWAGWQELSTKSDTIIEQKAFSNIAVSGSSYSDIDINITKTGYSASGIAGWQINGVDMVVTMYCCLINASTVRLRARNLSSNAQTITSGRVDVIYKKA